MKCTVLTVGLIVLAPAIFSACKREGSRSSGGEPPPREPRVSITNVTSAPVFPVAEPVSVAVDGDQPLLVAHAPAGDRRVLIFLHGKCGDARQDVTDIAGVAREHGTLVALSADQPCPEGGTRWTEDESAIQPRIDAALRAVASARGGALETSELTLIGESQGASRAEALASRYGDRYPYVVLFGAPTRARSQSFGKARAVAVVAAEREAQADISASADVLANAGIRSQFFEIPLAVHGSFGIEGANTMDEALTFLGRSR